MTQVNSRMLELWLWLKHYYCKFRGKKREEEEGRSMEGMEETLYFQNYVMENGNTTSKR